MGKGAASLEEQDGDDLEPEESDGAESIVGAVLDEVMEQGQSGEPVDIGEYLRRFPRYRREIRAALHGLGQFVAFFEARTEDGRPPAAPAAAPAGYQLLRPLGSGPRTRAYLAEQLSSRKLVTLKVLHPQAALDPAILAAFHADAAALAAFSHPCAASVHDGGSEGDLHYVVRDHLPEEPLESLLERRLRGGLAGVALPVAAESWCHFVLDAVIRISHALSHAHAQGLLHLNLKPANFFTDRRSGYAWVADFAPSHGLSTIPPSAVAMPAGCSSPEQIHGGKLDARSDVYSLGAAILRLLAGPGVQGSVPLRFAGAPRALGPVIECALSDDPRRRQQSVEELREDLIPDYSSLESGLAGIPSRRK
jgi:serine/threonine protein kinase